MLNCKENKLLIARETLVNGGVDIQGT